MIAPVHNLGALSLDSQPLKYSLRAEAANWKVAFSKTIHKRASRDLLVSGMSVDEACLRHGVHIIWKQFGNRPAFRAVCEAGAGVPAPAISPGPLFPRAFISVPPPPACLLSRPLTSTCVS